MNNNFVTVYSTPHCPQCKTTYRLLEKQNTEYVIVDVTTNEDAFKFVKSLGYQSVPVVITPSGEHWAGLRPDEIKALALAVVAA